MKQVQPKEAQDELPLAQRIILINLITIFLLATSIVTVSLYRQQTIERHVWLINQQFQISRGLSALYQHQIHLQRWIWAHHQESPEKQPPLFSADSGFDYTVLRLHIEQEATTLQSQFDALASVSPSTQLMTQYLDTWHAFDSQFSTDMDLQTDEDIFHLLADHLLELDKIIGELLDIVRANTQEEYGLLSNHAPFMNVILATAMLFCLVLIASTAHRFWQFIRQHQITLTDLQISERRHRALLETIPDIVLRRTREGIYTDYKPAQLFGQFTPREEFIGKHIREILTPEVAQQSIDVAEIALSTGQEQVYEYTMPHRLTGIITDYEARVIPSGEDEVQVIVRDVTTEKLQQERQQQAQKLESLGMLAGGIAHDFNNLLTGMMAQISLAEAKLQQHKSPQEQLTKALASTERAADLTRQLLAYAGKTNFQIIALNLNDLIRDNIGLLETAMPNRAELRITLADQLPPFNAARGEIQQVVMNIAINAAEAVRQAMIQSGRRSSPISSQTTNRADSPQSAHMQQQSVAPQTSSFETKFVHITTTVEHINTQPVARHIWGDEPQPGDYVALQIQDNGIGMEETTLQDIFDPYFSTKEQGHGLGLAATLGIVYKYDGSIYVESKPGVGSTFRILFPVMDVVADVRPVAEEKEKDIYYKETSTLLIIDDDAGVREVVVTILEADGFVVHQAENGEAGVEQFRQHKDAIDLVLLDMKMPGLSGDETLHLLREIQPTLKVIVSSGYTEREIDAYLQNAEVMAFLPKPFTLKQLVATVHSALIAPNPTNNMYR